MNRIATGWTGEVRSPAGAKHLCLLHSVQTGSRASYSVGTWGLYPGVELPGREADHSPASSAEVKNGGAIPPLPLMSSSRGA
jgi:hypothetical protein